MMLRAFSSENHRTCTRLLGNVSTDLASFLGAKITECATGYSGGTCCTCGTSADGAYCMFAWVLVVHVDVEAYDLRFFMDNGEK